MVLSPPDIRTILYRLDQQDKQLGEIKKHVQETNGRVRRHDVELARLKGALAVVVFAAPLVVALVLGHI